MKKIVIGSCKECPYAEHDIHDHVIEPGTRPIGKHVYRCAHPSLDRYGRWTDGQSIPDECPLENDGGEE